MNESDLIRLIRQVVKRELTPLLMAVVTETADAQRLTARRFASDGPIPKIRSIQPAGFASRPKAQVETVLAAIMGDPTNLAALGQFDAARPTIDAEGEAAIYGPDGQLVYLMTGGKVLIGSKDADEPLVLGNVLKSFADALIGEIKGVLSDLETTPAGLTTAPGNPIAPNPALVTALQAHGTSLDSMKSQYVDTDSSNFVSKKNFTERGGS